MSRPSRPESEGRAGGLPYGLRELPPLERTVRSVTGDAIVAPYQVIVPADSRFYQDLSDNVFRFMPVRLGSADLARIHGTYERVGIRDYEETIRLYRQLILNAAQN